MQTPVLHIRCFTFVVHSDLLPEWSKQTGDYDLSSHPVHSEQLSTHVSA